MSTDQRTELSARRRGAQWTAWRRLMAAIVLTPVLVGCPMTTPGDPAPRPITDTDFSEPNGSFNRALDVALEDGKVSFSGTVSQRGDIDVFAIGSLHRGDRIRVLATTPSSSLDVSICLFDAEGRLVMANDDREDAAGLDALIDLVIRHDGDPHYLAVSNSAFADPDRRTGRYEADVTVTGGATVPAPVSQVLWINWDGGRISSSSLGNFTLGRFDAARIAPVYDGQDDAIKAFIIATMEQNFERFNVTILSSDDGPAPEGGHVSTIHVGDFSTSTFGIAESVDFYNADRCDDAIIYAESFRPTQFRRTPTAGELGVAIGNVTAHEAGHLLGLNHVDDDLDIMDTVSPADAFLEDQEFLDSALSTDIMPIGTQDAVQLLTEIVGVKAP